MTNWLALNLDEYGADARFCVRAAVGTTSPIITPSSRGVRGRRVPRPDRTRSAASMHSDLSISSEECSDIADRLATGKREKARLEALVRDLEPWRDAHLQIARWAGTRHVVMMTGTVPSNDATRVRAMLREVSPLVSVAEYGGVGSRQAWIVLAHRADAEAVRAALATTQFVEVAFPGLADYPAESRRVLPPASPRSRPTWPRPRTRRGRSRWSATPRPSPSPRRSTARRPRRTCSNASAGPSARVQRSTGFRARELVGELA